MKAIESFSVSESFGLKDLNLDEIENINGGAEASVGYCVNISGGNTGILSGAVVGPTYPIGPGPVIISPTFPTDGPIVISGPSDGSSGGGSGGSSGK